MFERNRSEYAELACSAGAMFVTIDVSLFQMMWKFTKRKICKKIELEKIEKMIELENNR